ncbi:MAG TPA: hypothetical protein VGN07_02525 [Steroidobacteraceae bacterium]|jgi:mono/diheme cytochrome c family protein
MKPAAGRTILTIAGCLLLAACGGLSDVGSQDKSQTPPDAVVTVLGQPSTVSAGKVTLHARSGSELLLSGKDSVETTLPILTFDWQTRNDAAQQLQIVKRNASTIGFQVPAFAAATTLELRLVVTDSDGRSDTQDVDVNVDPVADPNLFLSYLGTPATFNVVAVASEDLPPCTTPGQVNCLSADVPFVIDVETRASYWDIGGQFNTGSAGANDGVVVDSRSFSGSWLGSLGASEDCNALENPKFSVPIPAFDADEIAAAVQSAAPARVVDASRIDEAVLTVTVKISQPAGAVGLPAGERHVCVAQFSSAEPAMAGSVARAKSTLTIRRAPDTAAAQVEFTTKDLLAVLTPAADPDAGGTTVQDSSQTATAYYASIDDATGAAQKQTFIGWLKFNGFLPATQGPVIDWAAVATGSDAHATYVNNFDLGFGRDMYERKLNCTTAGPDFHPGDCDVASVVINYGSLEAAAKKLGPQLAVAMEYSRKGTSAARFVKFYTYAPNVQCDPSHPPAAGCSQFERVLSANLDGRGEKFMPGACTICHGGAPLGLDAADKTLYAAGGNVNAAFLLWDERSLLFSDNSEAGFPDNALDAAHHKLWLDTRQATQSSAIKSLNQLAALTYVDPPDQLNRYALPRQLVQGWYAGTGGAFNPDFVPPQWDTDAQQHALYLGVFAQYCRTCHISQIPNKMVGVAGSLDPFAGCGPESATSAYIGSNHQIAFGCYQQFANTRTLPDRVAAGLMPAARLTMDRFWVNPGKSAAQALAEHLNVPVDNLRPATRPDIVDAEVRLQGASTTSRQPFDEQGGLRVVRRGSLVRVNGDLKGGSGDFLWTVVTPAGADANLSAATGLQPSFKVDFPGTYPVTLAAGGTIASRTVNVPNWKPVGVDTTGIVAPGTPSISLDVLASSTVVSDDATHQSLPLVGTNDENGDATHRLSICAVNTAASSCTATTLQTTLGGQVSIVPHATAQRPTIRYVPGSAGEDAFRYRIVDIDGDGGDVTWQVAVRVVEELAAVSQCDNSTLSTGQSAAIDLSVDGGIPPYAVQFADPTRMTQSAGPLTWRFTAPPEAAQGAPKIFTGRVCRPYTVTDKTLPTAQSAGATLTLHVRPREPWINGQSMMGISALLVGNATCTGCHKPVQNVPLPGGLDLTGDATTVWTRLQSRVDTTTPTSSRLLECPGGGGVCNNHGDFFPDDPSVETDTYSRILLWIKEGALNNSDTSNTCAVAAPCP